MLDLCVKVKNICTWSCCIFHCGMSFTNFAASP